MSNNATTYRETLLQELKVLGMPTLNRVLNLIDLDELEKVVEDTRERSEIGLALDCMALE